jgi:hypothetical protein
MKKDQTLQCNLRIISIFLLALSACTPELAPVASLESFSPTIGASPTVLHDRATSSVSPTPDPPATSAPTPATELAQTDATSEDKPILRLSAVTPVTIYSGPGVEFTPVGTLEAGANAGVTERGEDTWLKITCPPITHADSCWVFWELNKIYAYEGDPMTLSIPDPATLEIATTNTSTSPDGSWQVEVTQSETVLLAVDDAPFFYVELIARSLLDSTTWIALSEWRFFGLGHEYAPAPFHWSQDGRYLYFASLYDLSGACASRNIGEGLERLDLTDGSVDALQPPQAYRYLAISPDETLVAYLTGTNPIDYTRHTTLVVRELAAAYIEGVAAQDTILWQIPLEISWPTAVGEITWTPDSRKLLVTEPTMADEVLCNQAGASTWELDVETGVLNTISIFITEPAPMP